MRTNLLTLLLITYVIAGAQSFEEQIARIYPPISSMNHLGFQVSADGKPNKSSKYTSYKTQTFKQATGLWEDKDSIVCFYNSQTNMISEVVFTYNNGWHKSGKSEINFNVSGLPETDISYKWNEAENKWLWVAKKEYLIDTVRGLFSVQQRYSYPLKDWQNAPKDIYMYNLYGKDTMHVHEKWDPETDDWENDFREFKTYDATSKRLTSSLMQHWQNKNKSWQNSWRSEYAYDTNGNEIAEYSQEATLRGWENHSLDSTFYDALNFQIDERKYLWSKDSSFWYLQLHAYYEHTDKNNPESYSELRINRSCMIDSLKPLDKDIRTFDSVGNLTNRYLMSPENGGWRTFNHDSAVFDNKNNVLYFLRQMSYRGNSGNNSAIQTFYYYKPYNVAARGESNNELLAVIYPNPSKKGEVNLKLDVALSTTLVITIVDAQGKRVSNETRNVEPGSNNLLITHTELSPGIYYLEAVDHDTGKKSAFKWEVQ